MRDTSKLIWQIRYVDNQFNHQVEPYDIKCFDYNDIDKALQYLDILTEANLTINGAETWFILELQEIVSSTEHNILLSHRGRE